MQKNVLIFDELVDGHHLEYIHHLYLGAVGDCNSNYFFLLSPDFENIKKKLLWPTSENVTILYISDNENNIIRNIKGIYRSLILCRIVRKAIFKNNIHSVFVISLMGLMPFLPFFINRRIKVSGIIYLIYLYRWNNARLQSRISDVIKYVIFSKSKIFDNIFLLNDNIAPIYLNRKFRSKVFKYLPDPFMPIPQGEFKNLRVELNIPKDKIVCLHFGALTERKGTIEILKAILETNIDSMNKCCFIFAGKIQEDIKEAFYLLVSEAKNKTDVIIYDEHIEYNFIGSLCLTSNYLLIPYKNPEQSSGVLGYGAQFEIPVVGPRLGLLGKLIKRYNLGILLESSSCESLRCFFENIENLKFKVDTNYIREKKVSVFSDIIFKK
jgi:hypothetical protein